MIGTPAPPLLSLAATQTLRCLGTLGCFIDDQNQLANFDGAIFVCVKKIGLRKGREEVMGW